MDVQIIAPWPADDDLSEALRRLTQAIDFMGAADGKAGGLFGGEWGYGADYENAVFMIHRYCWCESADCPWCAGCECDGPWTHEIAGRIVDDAEHAAYWKAYQATGKLFDGSDEPPQPWGVWPRDVKSTCLSPCRVCRGEFGNAPNFRHKASGAEVRWYKYIGRGMEMTAPVGASWADVFRDCHASLERSQAAVAVDPHADSTGKPSTREGKN